MENQNSLLRRLPKVDEMINRFVKSDLNIPLSLIKIEVHNGIDYFRKQILDGYSANFTDNDEIYTWILNRLKKRQKPHLKGLINATGVILHTNLGRSRISKEVLKGLEQVATGYSNLEYDIEEGKRGSRYSHVEQLLIHLTGAEAALVVNNNAAAVLLVLDTLMKNKEVIVSRGELVEIGGSFRIPSIMTQSGCKLIEVGTTNKTHLSDYIDNINDQTGALFKVHTSNYKIVGFSEEVELSELYKVGKQNNVTVIYDLGSGLLADLKTLGIGEEPTVSKCVPFTDVLCFSGDKLMGGPQAGIIVGRRRYIDKMKKNNLLRALRIDKLTLSVLEYTLREYLNPEKVINTVPTLNMITLSEKEIEIRAHKLLHLLSTDPKYTFNIIQTQAQIGGGTMPDVYIPSLAVTVSVKNQSTSNIEQKLRQMDTPVICRISKDSIILDMRTVLDYELESLAECINSL